MKTFLTSVLIVATLIVSGCNRETSDVRTAATGEWAREQSQTANGETVAVEGVELSRGTIVQRIEAAGTVRGASEVTVLSEAQGIIQQADFDLGQSVASGDVLVRVENTVARLSADEARQVYESSRLDLSAMQRRFDNGSASQVELTRARSVANGALARLEMAEKNLRDQTIRAPVEGRIAIRPDSISRGNFLDRGMVVARIVDLRTIRVRIGVGEQELRYIAVGDEVEVLVTACGPDPIPARVHAIAAGAEDRTGSFPVVVSWENRCDSIRSGMNALVRITPQNNNRHVIVPAGALRSDAEGAFVFVLHETDSRQIARRRPVTTGDRLGNRIQVVAGLAVGEVVLTSGLSTLRDGDPVQVTVTGVSGARS